MLPIYSTFNLLRSYYSLLLDDSLELMCCYLFYSYIGLKNSLLY
jgi:hypothetical protein